jgi:VWFA-related protein
MLMSERFGVLFLVPLLYAHAVPAQDAKPLTAASSRPIQLNVVVTDKSGAPVSGLQLDDFTLLDNNEPRTVISFEAVDRQQAHVEVVLVIDAVIGARELAIEREEINRFLKAGQGRLAYPTTFAVLTETGIHLYLGFSQDGKALSSALGNYRIPRRSMGRDTDRGGSSAPFGFAQLFAEERYRPGRKLIVWISPSGLVFSRSHHPLDAEEKQRIFASEVELSKQLRESQTTLYLVDPSGIADIEPGMSLPDDMHLRSSGRTAYIAGASNPSEARLEDLALPVIAMQSGGLTLHPGNDMASALQECVSDAGAYYEISFYPVIDDQTNEYHHLEVRVAKPGLTARTIQGYYSQPPRAENFTTGSEPPSKDSSDNSDNSPPSAALADASNAVYANAHPYLDWPLAQLTERIPELKPLQPAAEQNQLPRILQNMGARVDDFIRTIGDLIAHEDISQVRLNPNGKVEAKERVQDNYLILHHGHEWGASAEYRMDNKGARLGPVGLEKGFLVTSGYALSCIRFSTVTQAQSRFRYLGDERVGSRDTYVLGFAQKPGEATFTNAMRGTGGREVDTLEQGILWVDKDTYQIVRMRDDLLVPNAEIGLDQLTTDVSFSEVQLEDVPNPLWLPKDVTVGMEINKEKYRNEHHYTNYRRYRVSVKIGSSQ